MALVITTPNTEQWTRIARAIAGDDFARERAIYHALDVAYRQGREHEAAFAASLHGVPAPSVRAEYQRQPLKRMGAAIRQARAA